MSICSCFECGNDSGKWEIKKSTRKYEGEGYCFTLDVETPYCKKCGDPIYDREIEGKIRVRAHRMILKGSRWFSIPFRNSKKLVIKCGC